MRSVHTRIYENHQCSLCVYSVPLTITVTFESVFVEGTTFFYGLFMNLKIDDLALYSTQVKVSSYFYFGVVVASVPSVSSC